MAHTPKYIELDVRAPGLEEAIRSALEIAWDEGWTAGYDCEVYEDASALNPYRKVN